MCKNTSSLISNSLFPGSSPVAIAWNSGNGFITGSDTLAFSRPAGGNYPVSIAVSNSAGCSDTTTRIVPVKNIPILAIQALNDCAGETTIFSQSASQIPPDSITSIIWNFGDGTADSGASASHIYTQSGNYSVSLLATLDNGCSDSVAIPLSISTPPSALFSSSTACAGQQTAFSNLSTSQSAPILSYRWFFGDGNSSTLTNPTYTYTTPGTYTVSLIAFTGVTCSDTFSQTINVLPKPQPLFTIQNACAGTPVSIQSNATASGQIITNWVWSINAFTPDSLPQITLTFDTGGTFPITHTVITDSGCFASLTQNIASYYNPIASFSASGNCDNTNIQFTNTSLIHFTDFIASCQWDFGNGASSSQCSPLYTYPSFQSYNAQLIVQTDKGCRDTIIQSAGAPNVQFTVPQIICEDVPVNIINASSSLETFDWDFCAGELGSTSIQFSGLSTGTIWTDVVGIKSIRSGTTWFYFGLGRSGNKLIRTSSANSPNNAGTFAVDLGNLGGLLIKPIGLDIVRDGNNFIALVVNESDSARQLIRLNFGSSLTNTPTATNLGNWGLSLPRNVKMIRENGQCLVVIGSSGNNRLTIISFGSSYLNNPAQASKIDIPLSISGSLAGFDLMQICCTWYAVATSNSSSMARIYSINMQSTLYDTQISSPNLVYTQPVSFGNNHSFSDVKLVREGGFCKAIAAWTFNSSSRLAALNFGSNMSLLQTPSVQTITGLGGLNYGMDLIQQDSRWYAITAVFSPNTQRGLYRTVFTDTCSVQGNPLFTGTNPPAVIYNQPGNFRIAVDARAEDCIIRQGRQNIQVNQAPNANFSFTSNCLGSITSFENLSTINGSLSSVLWNWQLGNDSTSSLFEPGTIYPAIDTYTVRLIATTPQGCTDTITQPVFISESPQANFSSVPGCEGDVSQFFNQSTFTFDPITETLWSWGNNISSSLSNPNIILPASGNLDTRLIVRNANGCSDTAQQTIFIKDKPDLTAAIINTCLGDSVQFSANATFIDTTSINSILWNLGDGNTANTLNVTYSYAPAIQDYYPVLQVTGSNGCTDTLQEFIHIATPPTANFTFPDICANSPVVFTQQSVGSSDPVTRWLWTFPNKSDSVANPTNTFPASGTFPVQLIAVSPSWCADTIVKQVTILPSPIVQVAGDTLCREQQAVLNSTVFVDTPYSMVQAIWFPGDGSIDTSLQIAHTYTQAGTYQAILIVSASNGCSSRDTATVRVNEKPIADFTQQVACALAPVKLTNLSYIPSSGQISQYLWQWGNGETSSSLDTFLSFPNPGFYPVSLIATSTIGCSDTLTKQIEVFAPLQADFSLSSVCVGDSIRLEDQTASFSVISRVWSMGDNSPFRFDKNPVYLYSQPGDYTISLQVENAIGCIDSVSRLVTLYLKPSAAFLPLSACEGERITFADHSEYFNSQSGKYEWTIDTLLTIQPFPLYPFTQSGQYPVKLKVTSEAGCTDSTETIFTVHPKPEVSFTITPEYGSPPLNVNFQTSGSLASQWIWDFGDGNTDTGQNMTHIYTQNDTFNATLYAFTTQGCSDTFSNLIYVIPTDLDLAVAGVETEQIPEPDGSVSVQTTVVFYNAGSRIIRQIEWMATLGQAASLTESWNGLLYPGAIQSYVFVSRFRVNDRSRETYICVKGIEVNQGETEINLSNNIQCHSLSDFVQLIGPWPNPAETTSHLGIILQEAAEVSIDVVNGLGQIIAEQSYALSEGVNEVEFPVLSWSRGIYMLRIRIRDDVFYKKLHVR